MGQCDLRGYFMVAVAKTPRYKGLGSLCGWDPSSGNTVLSSGRSSRHVTRTFRRELCRKEGLVCNLLQF